MTVLNLILNHPLTFALLAAAAVATVAAVVVMFHQLAVKSAQDRRDLDAFYRLQAQQHRAAYIPRHSADGDTIRLPIPAELAAAAAAIGGAK